MGDNYWVKAIFIIFVVGMQSYPDVGVVACCVCVMESCFCCVELWP